jgi:1-aminocyclopropane-1-carboxylate deaminase
LHTKPFKQNIPSLSQHHLVDILRLDVLHPIVSGNKFFKIRFYFDEVKATNATTIASFGGPYSNHIVALAYTAREAGLKSIGYIRTNEHEPMTTSLAEAMSYGMDVVYLGRTEFQTKKEAILLEGKNNASCYFVDEGGYGHLGAKGAATILTDHDTEQYNYIITAVGTGTMIAGCINAAQPNQKVIGIPVLKNEGTIHAEINALLTDKNKAYNLLHQFHQGGYAKTNPTMIEFMNAFWEQETIPTDIVYTSKLLFAVDRLIKDNYFEKGSRILVIHSGGLQGNRSLPAGTLLF